jgi:glycosyltransferase involved in cell wall biosynthesis
MTRTETSSRRVLMFAFFFPPLGGGGVQRTLKYVKYLPSEGFESIVVTASPSAFPLRDVTLARDVPSGTVVIRARTVPIHRARWKLDGLARRARLPTRLVAQIGWPDAMVGWLPAAVWHGLRAARTRRPDVLYSTSSPTTAHLAALVVHRLTGIPWVADFRDGWTMNPHADPFYAPLARASAALERKVLSEVAFAVTPDESVQLLGLPNGDSRLVVIPNGVDPDDIALSSNIEPTPGCFRLAHVGSLYGTHTAAPVIAAIRKLIADGRLEPSRFELRIVGHANLGRARLESLPITRTGYVEHQRAVEEMARASALLFYINPENRGSSGKIYEYLAVGRPVLCVASRDNLGYGLVEELGAGECANARDEHGVARALERLMAQWRAGTLGVDPGVRDEALRRFSRRKLASDLAAVLRSAIIGDAQRQGGAERV